MELEFSDYPRLYLLPVAEVVEGGHKLLNVREQQEAAAVEVDAVLECGFSPGIPCSDQRNSKSAEITLRFSWSISPAMMNLAAMEMRIPYSTNLAAEETTSIAYAAVQYSESQLGQAI